MRATLHFPTEQYGFAEVEIEVDEVSDAIDKYKRATGQIGGIPEKEMDSIADKMIYGETIEGGIELYEKMNPEQKTRTQWLKRAMKRAEARDTN